MGYTEKDTLISRFFKSKNILTHYMPTFFFVMQYYVLIMPAKFQKAIFQNYLALIFLL